MLCRLSIWSLSDAMWAKGLSCTSSSYIIGEGLSPYFTCLFFDDLVRSRLPFSLHFDETTTTQPRKQMDLTLRYWSATHYEVWILFYTSLFFGHAPGEKVSSEIYNQIQNDRIPVDKMITLVHDGPNVNKTIFWHMNELILQDHQEFPGWIDLGSFTIHIIHNAFGKGIDQYGKDIDQLCMDLYFLFKHSASRHEDFKNVQIEMEVEPHNFQQHTEVWWLIMGPSIKRILKQWDAIIQFVAELAKDLTEVPESIKYKRVYMMLGAKEFPLNFSSISFLYLRSFCFFSRKLSSGTHTLW